MRQDIMHDKLDQLARLWSRMIACIVHDLTTPLVVTSMTGSTMRSILPDLISGYQLAVNHQLISEPLKEKYLKAVESNLLNSTGKNVNEALDFLSLLFPLCEQLFSDSPAITILSAKEVLQAAVEKLDPHTRGLVHLNCEYDFQFKGVPLFIDGLFENLFANEIKSIEKMGKGEIKITTDKNATDNFIYVRDSAPIREGAEKNMFDQFFFKKEEKIVPGLGFCKLALTQIGGDILYQVDENGAEFVIQFPDIS